MKKKMLIMVLALFVLCAGQILAEEEGGFRVFGVLHTGLSVQFTDKVDDGPFIYAGSAEKSDLVYLLLKASYANTRNTFGVDTGAIIKGDGIGTSMTDQDFNINMSLKIDNTFGWLRLFDGLLTIYGGGGDWEYNDPFTTPGPVDSNLSLSGFGTMFLFEPLRATAGHDLKLGLSAWVKEGHTTLINEAKYIFSAEYILNENLRMVGGFAYRQYGPKFYADEDAQSYDEQKAGDHRVNFGINYTGLSHLGFSKMAYDMEVRDLGGGRNSIRNWTDPYDYQRMINGDFSTVYPIYLGKSITWGTGPFTVMGSAMHLFRLGDDHRDYAPSLTLMLDTSYRLNNFIMPKLGMVYVRNSPAFGEVASDLRWNEGLNNTECEKDTGGLQVRAGVEFRVEGGLTRNVIEFGYSLKKDTSSGIVATDRNSTLDHGLYLSMSIHF